MIKTITLSAEELKECDRIVINIIINKKETAKEEISEEHISYFEDFSFSDFAKAQIDKLVAEHRFNTANGYKSALKNLKTFLDKDDISLKDITADNMKKFELWLKERDLFTNSISFYFRKLRAIYNKAVEQYDIRDEMPFRHVYTGKANTAKRAISKKEMMKLVQVRLESQSYEFAKDMFLLSFFMRGISFVDLAHLKKENISNNILTYKRKKTGQILRIRWEKCMEDIVSKYRNDKNDYLLPIITKEKGNEFNQYRGKLYEINKKLKEIGIMLHFEHPLTMYVARHSWASIAKQMDVPLSIISYGMGHDSEKTTNIYLKTFDYNKVDKANAKIINTITKNPTS